MVGVGLVLVTAPFVQGLFDALAFGIARDVLSVASDAVKTQGDDRRMSAPGVIGGIVEVEAIAGGAVRVGVGVHA